MKDDTRKNTTQNAAGHAYAALKATPRDYQIDAVQTIIDVAKGRALVALDMGLGKTPISIMYALRRPQCRPIVVVCPAGVKWNWRKELIRFAGIRSEVIDGTDAGKGRIKQKCPVWIINYDVLHCWVGFLRSLKPQIVVIDESQMTKSRKARRTKAVRKLCHGVRRILALSGTPLLNRPVELWFVLNLLWPKEFDNYPEFARRYCGRKKDEFGGWDDSGATNLTELHERMTRLGMIRVRKEDTLTELPPLTSKIVLVDVTDPNKEYEQARDKYLKWLNNFYNRIHLDKTAQRGHLNALRNLVGRLKLPAVFDWLDQLLKDHPDDKVIVFGWHRHTVESVYKRFSDVSVMVHGGVAGKRRQAVFEQFTKDPRVRLLSGNIQAAGVGWPGQAANHVAVIEFPWTPGDLAQAVARPHRIGQTKEVFAHFVAARDTIDHRLIQILERKQGILATTLDGKRRKEDFNVYDLVSQALKKEGRR